MATKAFFAYPEEPEIRRGSLFSVATELNSTDLVRATTWEGLRVDGRLVVHDILREVDGSDLFVAELTTLNPNVLFELGYAVGAGRLVWLLVEAHDTVGVTNLKKLQLLNNIGHFEWENSEALKSRFLSVRPDLSDSPLWPSLTEGAQPQSMSTVFFVPALHDSDPNRRLSRLLERWRGEDLTVISADPTESKLEPLSWYAEQIYASGAVIVHLESTRRTHHEMHNARAALVAGMAAGAQRPLLMLAETDYEVPFDYQELLRRYSTAEECAEMAEQFLASSPIVPTKQATAGNRRLAVELRSLRLGEHVAENEVAELPAYFIDTAAFDDLVRGDTALYVGRKGTGKSANMYIAASELRQNPSNLVVAIKPASYDLRALTDFLDSLEGSLQDHAIEAIWKFLLLTEVAQVMVARIIGRPHYLPPTDQERQLVGFVERAPFDFSDDVASRIELAVAWLSSQGVEGHGGVEKRQRLAEALHQEWIGELREAMAPLLAEFARIAVLVDNLDKGWDRRADLGSLSRLLLGLLTAVGHLERDIAHAARRSGTEFKVSLALFLRSDIYSYLVSNAAREPDKINVRTVEWTDKEVLLSILEQRYLAQRSEGTTPDEMWSSYFPSEVSGMPARDYLASRCLPRPRDMIYFANACIRAAIDRRHDAIKVEDVRSAERLYSQFAFEALLVENGITIEELESVLLEFLGAPAVMTEEEIVDLIRLAKVEGIRSEQVLRRLKEMSFLGVEVASDRFEFAETGREAERAEVLARKHSRASGGSERLQVHPAYRAYLEIEEP